ncbi:MAG: hypothetical protein A3K19_14915 [Lentisphaerae bacterium RIFOXYB12_FULL_65_16]|nr:MAG: hypothetical protein A3K18_27475 [Lentisphaerae bacterium RIFOXYA12_64_32]OGV85915.1 MAG: hypothetical protein A3K19_14915 [Lentisphaerae bacterium RIFOXYB12_FULL_65_16]
MNTIADKDEFSILITDSGMGGLSVCAEIVERLHRRRDVARVAVTYFNAWPEQNRGYNALPDTAARVRVFDCALAGMQKFRPDVILIACNTLSVLYPQTQFHLCAPMPVVGIVDHGVRMIRDQIAAEPDSRVIIFGTPTTVEAGAHRAGLIAAGMGADRIVSQPCARLAGAIEDGPECPAVRAMIGDYVLQAVAQLPDKSLPVSAALCCTHYGFSERVFLDALATHVRGAVTILNPNKAMAAHPFPATRNAAQATVQIDLNVVSRIAWSEAKIATISNVLASVSPRTADAVRHYRHDPELFAI